MKALIVVDIQNDFLPGGALSIENGDEVIPIINRLIPAFSIVIATKDWHPANHGSFAANHPNKSPGDIIDLFGLQQILWPTHCVPGSKGAEFAPTLNTTAFQKTIYKGTNKNIDSYSCFFDNGHKQETEMRQYLMSRGIKEIYLAGLATDYCVRFTAMDALRLGFKTFVIEDAVKGVNINPDDSKKALEEIREHGGFIIHSSDILNP